MNAFGRLLRLSLFGEAHGAGVGVVVDGLPPGWMVDVRDLRKALQARRPGASPLTSSRDEPDEPRLLSGIHDGRTTGAPVCVWIENHDARPQDYGAQGARPRPGHADFPSHVRSHGHHDPRGGGHNSGRLTAPLVAAGVLADLVLRPHGIRCAAHLHQVGPVAGPAYAHNVTTLLKRVPRSALATAHGDLEEAFAAQIHQARKDRDSVGGVIEFLADGLPPGLGEPFFDGLESTVAHILFAVPAVKGVEFGAGFAAAAMRGSQHNDPIVLQDGAPGTRGNHAGGILGGRTSGAPIAGHVAVKPASTLPGRDQQTVDLLTGEPAILRMTGRHDPCIAVRAVPVVQACLRIALADHVLMAQAQGFLPAPRPVAKGAAAPTASQE